MIVIIAILQVRIYWLLWLCFLYTLGWRGWGWQCGVRMKIVKVGKLLLTFGWFSCLFVVMLWKWLETDQRGGKQNKVVETWGEKEKKRLVENVLLLIFMGFLLSRWRSAVVVGDYLVFTYMFRDHVYFRLHFLYCKYFYVLHSRF